jgi:hypothetical protein
MSTAFGRQKAQLSETVMETVINKIADGMFRLLQSVGPAIAAEDMFKYSGLNPGMGGTIRKHAEFSPLTPALMHGPSFKGDGAAAFHALADSYVRHVIDSENGQTTHNREAA